MLTVSRQWLLLYLAIIVFSVNAKTPGVPENLRLDGSASGGLYLGIPPPSSKVPSGIMPTLPNKSSLIDAFPYDPIEMETPTWENGTQQYWIDAGIQCDDTNNNGRGSPTNPRCTLPGVIGVGDKTWTLAAGDHVFIVGNGQSYYPGSIEKLSTLKFPGTAAKQIWIIGVSNPSSPRWLNQPKLEVRQLRQGDNGVIRHTVIENIHLFSAIDRFGGSFGARETGNDGMSYFVMRKVTCSGSGTDLGFGTESLNNSNCFSFHGSKAFPSEFILIYDSDIFGRGRWLDDFNTNKDLHGIQINRVVRYFWYLNNRSFHLQGDSIQCSNSNEFDFNRDERPHFIYVGGNELYENYENAYDTKGCYHVVFSENYVHDFTNSVKTANNTAITTAQDAEGFVGDAYGWFLNNRIENVGDPFAYKATTDDGFSFILGNLVVNTLAKRFLAIEGRCFKQQPSEISTCGDGVVVAMNTVDCNGNTGAVTATRSGGGAAELSQAEKDQEMTFIGNVFYNCTDAENTRGESPHGWESINSNFILKYNHNVDYRSFGSPIRLSRWNDEEIGNLTNIDPKFVNPNSTLSGDYTLGFGSSARRLVPNEPSVYGLFQELYGIDIRRDINGKAWRVDSRLNAGAVQ